MNATLCPPALNTDDTQPITAPRVTAAILGDDDFGDVELGARQENACTLEEGCTTCQ